MLIFLPLPLLHYCLMSGSRSTLSFNPFAPPPKTKDDFASLRPVLDALNTLYEGGDAIFTASSVLDLFEDHAADIVSPFFSICLIFLMCAKIGHAHYKVSQPTS